MGVRPRSQRKTKFDNLRQCSEFVLIDVSFVMFLPFSPRWSTSLSQAVDVPSSSSWEVWLEDVPASMEDWGLVNLEAFADPRCTTVMDPFDAWPGARKLFTVAVCVVSRLYLDVIGRPALTPSVTASLRGQGNLCLSTGRVVHQSC